MGKTTPSRPTVRNLQSIKGGSYTVTLPRWWIEKHNMPKGTGLFLAEDGASLKLTPMKLIAEELRAEVDTDKLEDTKSVKYQLWTYYMQGADEILVSSKDVMPANLKKQLREVRLDLPGIEVQAEDTHSILFTVAPSGDNALLDDMIRELHGLVLSIHRDAMGALANGSVELAKEVIGRETEVLRNYRAMIRKLAVCSMNSEVAFKSGIKDSRELITYGLVARDLNRTVYHSIYIARHVATFGEKLEGSMLRKLQQMSAVAYQMQELSVESFVEKDNTKVLKVLKRMSEVRSLDEAVSVEALNSSGNVRKAVMETLVAREIRRIAGYSIGIADATANRILSPSVTFREPGRSG